MRCPYCGNENPDDHRFCGMCGRPIPAPTAETPLPAKEPVRHRDPEPSAPAPAYTGGIFNLGAPPDRPYQNLDYLLEDDEERKSNKGIIFLCILALAMVGGLGWLRWRNGGLPWLKSQTSVVKTAPAPGTPDATSNSSPAEPPTPAGTQPPQPEPPSPTAPVPDTSSSAPAPSTPAPSSATTAAAAPAPAANTPPHAARSDESDSSTAPAASTPAAESNAAAPAPSNQPAEAPDAPSPAEHTRAKSPSKPSPKTPSKPAAKAPDQVTLGEQYLYGRGVPQNCERGLHYVKPAADQSNPKAMITMGALYATGHCLSRDLPTAYRFFALALRGDPDNAPLRQNAEMVWKQMTAEERKQAIRLTQ